MAARKKVKKRVYTDDIKRTAIALYADKGVQSVVAEELDIPYPTIHTWVTSEWGESMLKEVQHEKSQEHISLYQTLTKKFLEKANKGLDALGDELTAADLKSLVVAGATTTDKARLLLNLPTRISADTSTVKSLAEQFRALSEQWNEKQAKVISTQ